MEKSSREQQLLEDKCRTLEDYNRQLKEYDKLLSEKNSLEKKMLDLENQINNIKEKLHSLSSPIPTITRTTAIDALGNVVTIKVPPDTSIEEPRTFHRYDFLLLILNRSCLGYLP